MPAQPWSTPLTAAVAVLAASLAWGCGTDDGDGANTKPSAMDTQAGGDAASDAGPDAAADAKVTDAAPDALADAAAGADTSDATLDGSGDAGKDVATAKDVADVPNSDAQPADAAPSDTAPTDALPGACAKAAIASAQVQDRKLVLAASATTAGGKAVTSYAWSVQVPKVGGKLSPDATSAAVSFGPLVYRGDYEVCLQVTAAGEPACAATCQTLTFEPDLYLELTWLSPGVADPTGSESADLNLHLVRGPAASGKDLDCDGAADPWYDDAVAAYWYNDHPDWGSANQSSDDPWVDDAATAAKPEVISIELPKDGTYTVAVHALSDKGAGASPASLTVYFKGKLLAQQAGISLAQSDLWTVGAITLAAGTASFTTCQQSGDACKTGKLWQSSGDVCLTPCYEYKGLFSVPTPACAWKWP